MTNILFFIPERAIIIDAVVGLTEAEVKEYVQIVAKIIQVNAIRFVSRIFNDRICIYFHKKTTIKYFITNYKTSQVCIKSTAKNSSNVSLTILHNFITKFLTDYNIRLTSRLALHQNLRNWMFLYNERCPRDFRFVLNYT